MRIVIEDISEDTSKSLPLKELSEKYLKRDYITLTVQDIKSWKLIQKLDDNCQGKQKLPALYNKLYEKKKSSTVQTTLAVFFNKEKNTGILCF